MPTTRVIPSPRVRSKAVLAGCPVEGDASCPYQPPPSAERVVPAASHGPGTTQRGDSTRVDASFPGPQLPGGLASGGGVERGPDELHILEISPECRFVERVSAKTSAGRLRLQPLARTSVQRLCMGHGGEARGLAISHGPGGPSAWRNGK